MGLTRLAAMGGIVALAVVVPLAQPAFAEVTGGCSGTIKGVDVATKSSTNINDAILVERTENITVGATAPGPIDRYKIQLAFAGINWTIAKGSGSGNTWSKSVNVKPYARYGVGLYKVSGVSSGGANCTGAALVRVKGSPFGSVLGIVGLALSVIGVGAVARNGVQGFRCGLRPAQLVQSASDPLRPVEVIARDIQTPRGYVDTVQSICTYNPSRYPPFVREICGNARPRIQQICLWG